ncbi:MAG: YebC/PmpR family DNA-binding transcriptional regulator [Deltaproteobacteria bacterium]|nr:YebC/PmpR family DNA-binding transcriptional regulator [Deltaproteobacteria bacterium]
MSGHSKWSTIKHKKGAADAKRGKLFTKLIKEITISARIGGGDPTGNARLRAAVATARSNNMPSDNIDRAIKRGTGELEGISYEEITYEAYGPGGVALLVEVMTDNRTRTVGEIRHMLTKHNGNLGETGSVGWMFHKKGIVAVPAEKVEEDALMEAALEAGADDVQREGDFFQVLCAPAAVEQVGEALRGAKFEVASAKAEMVPQTTVKLEGRDAEVMLKLMGGLEDHDDVQNVWANFDIDDALLEQLAG